ncbi:MAG: hypothetical protein BalsKO_25440 [Balneolaceae bacterium]
MDAMVFRKAGNENPNNRVYQFGGQDNRPMEITSNQFFKPKNGIHTLQSGKRRVFVYTPEDYPYSSALWYKEKRD